MREKDDGVLQLSLVSAEFEDRGSFRLFFLSPKNEAKVFADESFLSSAI